MLENNLRIHNFLCRFIFKNGRLKKYFSLKMSKVKEDEIVMNYKELQQFLIEVE